MTVLLNFLAETCSSNNWSIWDLPETKGRTFADIDQLFEEHVSARKFKSTVVDPFNNAKMLQQFDKTKLNELANIKAENQMAENDSDIEKASVAN